MVQPPQFVLLDQQAFGTGSPWFTQPAAMASAPGQQAEDAVTMATVMWRMMNSMMFQQRQGFPTHGTGTPQTPGTPVGIHRFPGTRTTPKFPPSSQVYHPPVGADQLGLQPPSMPVWLPTQDTTAWILPEYTGIDSLSWQHTQNNDLYPVDSQPTTFMLDSTGLHHYDIFLQAVRQSLRRFRSSVDNAHDMDEEAGTLIPAGDTVKDKIT